MPDYFTRTEQDAGLYEAHFYDAPDDIDAPDPATEYENAVLAEYEAREDSLALYDARVEKYGEPHYLNADNPF